MVLILLLSPSSPLSPSSSELLSPGGCGTSSIFSTLTAFPDLAARLFLPHYFPLLCLTPHLPFLPELLHSAPLRSCRLCATAWVAPSMPASRPVYSSRLPQAIFALVPHHPHYELGNGPMVRLPNRYGARPPPHIQCNEATCHESTVGRPWSRSVSHIVCQIGDNNSVITTR